MQNVAIEKEVALVATKTQEIAITVDSAATDLTTEWDFPFRPE